MCCIGSQGMIWWWILLSASCLLSNSPQEMSTARKHKIVSLKLTHFRVSMSPHIPFTLTMACTYSFTMLPYSSANTHGIPHYWFTRCAPFSLTKGHGIWANHPNFFIMHNDKVPLLRYDWQRWTIWASTLPESRRSESIWNYMRNLWHFNCTFSPCLVCDSARLVKYFWAA